jgi:EmrB/QacA subfamily drug resistance transporter
MIAGKTVHANPAHKGLDYKWIALSTVILATLMGSVNASITLISLPAIFNGIQLNPLAADSFQYLLWILMGYSVVMAALLLTFGRLSDIYGRVRLFKLGFLVFTLGSVLLYLTPSKGDAGAIELILFRIVQAFGAAMFMANSNAILTDAFPASERGKALGFNMVAVMSGQFIGLILGGILAIYDWRLVFLVSVPFAVIGTIWSYLKLKELSYRAPKTQIDILGNVTFVTGLVALLVGVSYGLMPYQKDVMGWSNPWVIASIICGAALLIAFPIVETRAKSPMFRLGLFKIRAFSYANIASFAGAIARSGIMFVLILFLQGIYLPLHGVAYADTPLWAGIYMLPMTVGLIIMAPIAGVLSDRYGARGIATGGMVVVAASFILLAAISYNFQYWEFAGILLLMGVGNGMFGTPNSSSVMSSVPPEERGVASGMLSTMMNTALSASMVLFFTVIIVGLTNSLPSAIASSLSSLGAGNLAPIFSSIPPTGALFAAFLGYNPVTSILSSLPSTVLSTIPKQIVTALTNSSWFPQTLSNAFMPVLRLCFYIGAGLCAFAAILSALRGQRYIHETDNKKTEKATTASNSSGESEKKA